MTQLQIMAKIKYLEALDQEAEQAKWNRLMAERTYKASQKLRQDALDHSQGYCPKCHLLRALNGTCSCD